MGKLADIKTKPTEIDASEFLASVEDKQRREDSFAIVRLLEELTGEVAKMWGASLIGFGHLIYKSPKTGREVEWFKVGFSPRKSNLSIHLVADLNLYSDLFDKLGKHKLGSGCLYITKLSDVNVDVLKSILKGAFETK
ncbi:DUF1801 domain-containing protein [Sphingobacterium hungaricum]|uniref:DUF1801 domain-containing protein n=1 Tax=Sphingobacterium hungaricum TaxID=2082723 RepID=A0A928YRS5_9SPHI|nr:DUF1801 domain-containing protein [Sphingobacterium hungaricum]MBE8714987.1 DUF1801 domain-containing protein [Sphingobacterium hungaricum]